MTNALALAAVTTAFGQRVAEALHAVPDLSSSPELRWGRPAAEPGFVGANVFLYHVSPNPARRNDDLATRAADGSVMRRPQAALDLDYLLTFHGDEYALEPQRLMAKVIASLHAAPILSPERVRDAMAAAGPYGARAAAEYDLAASPIRFTLKPLDLEDLYRIWALFPQVPYALSLAYSGSTVLIEADLAPTRALPARRTVFAATPRPLPVIRAVTPPAVAYGPAAQISIVGDRFAGDLPRVLMGDQTTPANVQAGAITVALPAGLPAGRIPIQVAVGTGAATVISAAAYFILQPRIADGAVCRLVTWAASRTATAVVTCNIAPAPAFAQSVTLYLNPLPPGQPGQTAQSCSQILRAAIATGLADDLDGGAVTPALRTALVAAGVDVAAGTPVQVAQKGLAWRIRKTSAGTGCRLVWDDARIAVYYGLAADYPDGAIAFAMPEIGPGPYLMSVQIGPDTAASSPLRLGQLLFTIQADAGPLDQGKLPTELAARFAAAGIVVSPACTVMRPMPGDGWALDDGRGRYWIAQQGGMLAAYALDVANAPFFGPAVTIPGRPG